MKTSYWVTPVASVVLLFGGYGIGQATGVWASTGGAGMGQGAGGGEGMGTGAGGGQYEVTPGSITADDLRGWMTLQAAADGLGMPLADLIALIKPPAGVELTGDTKFKDVEPLVPGFELTTFRDTVRAATG